MKRPFLSVVMPTMRSGGMDIVFEGLKRQTFHDFELVISDGLYARRKAILADRSRGYSFHVTHVAPRGDPTFPSNDFCRYANTALIHARGQRLVFITDYTWLPSDALELHAAAPAGLMGPHQYVRLPEPELGFPRYLNCRTGQDTETYAADVAGGRHDRFLWSLWPSHPFEGDPRSLELDPVMSGADPKLHRDSGPIEAGCFHAKNESCQTERAIEMNGWDEKLDGTHGWQDSDFAERLGISWQLDQNLVAYIVNPRFHFPLARRNKDYRENEKIWLANKAAGYPQPNNWSLKDECVAS